MAASGAALVVREDGTLEATPELNETLHLTAGSRLELVDNDGTELRFRVSAWPAEIKNWRDLEGILKHVAADPNADLEDDKRRELESEGRW